MTGWQQVSGAATHNWAERVELDVRYVEHWNLLLDLRILIRTPWTVVSAKTVYGSGGIDRSSIPPQALTAEHATSADGAPSGRP